MAFSAGVKLLATTDSNGLLELWDTTTGNFLFRIEFGNSYMKLCSFSLGGSHLLTLTGALDLAKIVKTGLANWSGCGIDKPNARITYNDVNVLWLPPEYQPLKNQPSSA